MSNISRATLPAEYFDVTSAQMLLQPEPQYLHALLIKGAIDAELTANAPIGLQIPGREFPVGGAAYLSAESGRLTLSDPILSNAVKAVVEFSQPMVGHTLRMNRPAYAASTFTRASRAAPVGTTFSTSPIGVGSEQVSMTIERFAGPYDNTAGGIRPYGIEKFDANKSIHNMQTVREHFFQRDFDRWLDTVGVNLFDDASTAIYPVGMTAVNDSLVAEDFPFSWEQVLRVGTSLANANIPTFADGRWCMIITPLQWQQLQLDPVYRQQAKYDPKFNPLYLASHVATVGKFHLFQSAQLNQTNNSNSIPIQYGQAFGPGMVGVGSQGMPWVAPNTQDNYGETVLALWIAYMAFQVLDNRFGRSVRSS